MIRLPHERPVRSYIHAFIYATERYCGMGQILSWVAAPGRTRSTWLNRPHPAMFCLNPTRSTICRQSPRRQDTGGIQSHYLPASTKVVYGSAQPLHHSRLFVTFPKVALIHLIWLDIIKLNVETAADGHGAVALDIWQMHRTICLCILYYST